MSEEEKEKFMTAAGMCNFFFLFLLTTTAMSLTWASTGYCAFVSRNVQVDANVLSDYCSSNFNSTLIQCESFFDNHRVGFWGWQVRLGFVLLPRVFAGNTMTIEQYPGISFV